MAQPSSQSASGDDPPHATDASFRAESAAADAVEEPRYFAHTVSDPLVADIPTLPRTKPPRETRSIPPESTPLTPAQKALDQRLREWRTTEAERLGLPQFFVLGTSTLRSIVLNRPQTIAELKAIEGISHEKLEKFGAGILEACNS